MNVFLGFFLLLASTIDVQAKDLRLDKEGTLFAQGDVVIRWRGRVFRANEARLDRKETHCPCWRRQHRRVRCGASVRSLRPQIGADRSQGCRPVDSG